MPLNKQKGNMYPWVTHTWNPIKGKCPHDCSYCYMKGYPQPELHFDENELHTNLGTAHFIFVGSSCDDFALPICSDWITKILRLCNCYQGNRYLFQSKNPGRFGQGFKFPPDTILGTTIETNRDYHGISRAPIPWNRMMAMTYMENFPKMLSIEPIMDFDLDVMSLWVKSLRPEFVSIGADSKGHHLPEPSADKIQSFIQELQKTTAVKIKQNLERLLNRQEFP